MAGFHSRDLRKGRRSEAGRPYLVTVATFQRRQLLGALMTARGVVRALRHMHELGHVESHCFVVMPDHFHWLFTLGTDKALAPAVQSAKAMASRNIRALAGSHETVWQRGFHDRAIRRDEDLAAVARYVVANPLRAGLVDTVGEWPHWDAAWL